MKNKLPWLLLAGVGGYLVIWVFVLNPLDDQRTRFILRTRARYGPPLFRQLSLPLIYLSEALFPRFLLHGIKKRAEKEQGR
jgi:hypothetical protein